MITSAPHPSENGATKDEQTTGASDSSIELLNRPVDGNPDLTDDRVVAEWARQAASDPLSYEQTLQAIAREDRHRSDAIRMAVARKRQLYVDLERTLSVATRTFRFVPVDDLANRPPPRWLIDGIILQNTLVVLAGKEASGKSFLALDWAMCISSGTAWQGFEVARRGRTAYIVAEGADGLWRRVESWRVARGVQDSSELYVLESAPLLRDQFQVAALIDAVRTVGDVDLIVVDTLARTFGGGDENNAKDMGEYIEGAERLRRFTHATVLLIHHEPKSSGSPRGSSALPAAASTVLSIKKWTNGAAQLSCDKQKDAAEFDGIDLRLNAVAGTESCAFSQPGAGGPAPTGVSRKALSLLRVLRDDFPPDGAASSAWERAAGMSGGSFYRPRNELDAGGYVLNLEPGRRGSKYWITETGLQLLQEPINGPSE